MCGHFLSFPRSVAVDIQSAKRTVAARAKPPPRRAAVSRSVLEAGVASAGEDIRTARPVERHREANRQRNCMVDEKRHQMSHAALARCRERFSIEAYTANMERFYRDAALATRKAV